MSGGPLIALAARACAAGLASPSMLAAGTAVRTALGHTGGPGGLLQAAWRAAGGADAAETVSWNARAPGTLCTATPSTSALCGSLWTGARTHTTAVAEAAVQEAEYLTLDDSAVQRLQELQQETPDEQVVLRISVEAGGCSGFQYVFDIAHGTNDDDIIVRSNGATLVCDTVSLEFVKGATIQYVEDLIRAGFEVAANPNSDSSCGCGSSFVAKME